MSNHTATTRKNQEENTAFVEITNEQGISETVEVLLDDKFPWVETKKKSLQLARLYRAKASEYHPTDRAGDEYAKWAERSFGCGSFLEYWAMIDGRRTLKRANLCKLRLCPTCNRRRAKKNALQLARVLERVQADHPGTQFLFLTLTVQNCPGDVLAATLDLMMYAWSKLRRQRPVHRAIKGWYRALEITLSGNTYHPHFHVILAVEPDYFKRASGLYITQADWEARWGKALGVQYKPRVDIRAAHSKGELKSCLAAALEAAKYATKDTDYLKPGLSLKKAVEVVTTYTHALKGRRLIAYGDWMADAVQALNVDFDSEDLVHIDDQAVREETAELEEGYSWWGRQENYRLEYRRPVERQDGGPSSDSTLGPGPEGDGTRAALDGPEGQATHN